MIIHTRVIKFIAVISAVISMFFMHSWILNLWYDEAVQLAISHATNPESLDSYRYVIDPAGVLKWNRLYNMDPGGYSILLNLLSPIVGPDFYLYRVLSILFFVSGIALILRRVTGSLGVSMSWLDSFFWSSMLIFMLTAVIQVENLSYTLGKLVNNLPIVSMISQGFSIRGYGLQLLLVSTLIYASGWFRTYIILRYILVAFLLFIGCMIRYDFLLFAAAYVTAIFIDAYLKGEVKRLVSFPGFWITAFSTFAGFLTAYLLSYTYQMGAGGSFTLPQLIPFVLDNPKAILNFLSTIRNIIAIIVLAVILLRMSKYGVGTLEILYLILFFLYMSLSLMGLYPFSFINPRCLSINLLLDVMLLHLSIIFIRSKRIFHLYSDWGSRIFFIRKHFYISILAILSSFLIAFSSYRLYGAEFLSSTMLNNNFFCFEKTMDLAKRSKVYISYWGIPEVSASFQLKNKKIPSHSYQLGILGPHSEVLRRMSDRVEELKDSLKTTNCDYYLTFWSHDREFTNYMLGRFEKLPCSNTLFRKK